MNIHLFNQRITNERLVNLSGTYIAEDNYEDAQQVSNIALQLAEKWVPMI